MCYNQKLPSSMKQNPYPIGFLCTYMYLIKIDSLKGRLIYHTWIHRSIMGVAALSSEVVQVTESCGAIRHGAECFNFYFPQANVVSHVVSHFVVWVNCRSLGGWYSNPTLLNDWYWLPIIYGKTYSAFHEHFQAWHFAYCFMLSACYVMFLGNLSTKCNWKSLKVHTFRTCSSCLVLHHCTESCACDNISAEWWWAGVGRWVHGRLGGLSSNLSIELRSM